MQQKPILRLVTPKVLDVNALWRTAFWLSRSLLVPGSIHWSVAGESNDEIVQILSKFSVAFSWDTGFAETALDSRSEFTGVLASDAILMPNVLPDVLEVARLNPTCVITPPARRLSPETLISFNFYGSNFLADRAKHTPHIHGRLSEAALAVWSVDSARGSDPELEAGPLVYTQVSRDGIS